MKKDVKALLSVSMAVMNVSSPSTPDVDKDIVLDARDDMDDSLSSHFYDTIPSMDGIPARAFHWRGLNFTKVCSPIFSR